MHAPRGWTRLDTEVDGVPVWKADGEPVYVATRDTDQLLFLRAALVRFERMSPQEFVDFVTEVGA